MIRHKRDQGLRLTDFEESSLNLDLYFNRCPMVSDITFLKLLSSPTTRIEGIKVWQQWRLQYNPSSLSKEIKSCVHNTVTFIDNLRKELESIVPKKLLYQNGNSIEFLTYKSLGKILGMRSDFITKVRQKATKRGYYKIALDVLLKWRNILKNKIDNTWSLNKIENAINLIDAYIQLHKPVILLSGKSSFQLYRTHPFIKEDYFSVINTIEKAYWLGFFFADGSIIDSHGVKQRIVLKLGRASQEQLIKWCGALGLNPNSIGELVERLIYQGELREYRQTSVTFISSAVTKDLERLGFTYSNDQGWPSIDLGDPLLDLAFLLGFYDGEGITGTTQIELGSKKMLEEIKDRFNIDHDVLPHTNRPGHYYLFLGSQLVNLMQAIYRNSMISKRKDFQVSVLECPISNLNSLMTKELLEAILNRISPTHLSEILKVDVSNIYDLIEKWKIEIPSAEYYERIYNIPKFLGSLD